MNTANLANISVNNYNYGSFLQEAIDSAAIEIERQVRRCRYGRGLPAYRSEIKVLQEP